MAVQEVDMDKLYDELMAFDRFLGSQDAPAVPQSSVDTKTGSTSKSAAVDIELQQDDMNQIPVVEEVVVPKHHNPMDGNRIHAVKEQVCTVVQSTLGQIVLLIIYSFLGAAVLNLTESFQQEQNFQELAEFKEQTIGQIILNVSQAAAIEDIVSNGKLVVNESSPIWVTLDELVTEYGLKKESLRPYSSSPGWSFWGALFFCGTVYTTVGYGSVYPLTTEGRVITMIYAIIGIPLCLVVLMNLGKAFTHAIKHVWSFIRRFYYTGSCRRVRTMIPSSRLRMTVFQRVRQSVRRRSTKKRSNAIRRAKATNENPNAANGDKGNHELERLRQDDDQLDDDDEEDEFVPYEIDDTFNLPPVVALLVMIIYMLLGCVIYPIWEESWTPFDAFYFIFISLSTIGLGDVVPQHTKFFMMTSLYIFIGLALVAMVINVVMEEMNVAIAKAADMIVAARPRLDEESVARIIKNLQMRQEASKPPPQPEVEEAIEETLVSAVQSCPTHAGINGHVIASARFPGDNLHVDSLNPPARVRRSSM